eukprot:3308581-Pleurochrysis_carterae.AAC.1
MEKCANCLCCYNEWRVRQGDCPNASVAVLSAYTTAVLVGLYRLRDVKFCERTPALSTDGRGRRMWACSISTVHP